MALVMSNDGATFRVQDAESKSGLVSSRARRLQRIALGQGLAVLTAVFAVGAMAWSGFSRVQAQEALNPVVTMTVGKGETMWSLARRYGDPAASQWDRVDSLARANGLSASATLHPGQRLLVPVENPAEAERFQAIMVSR